MLTGLGVRYRLAGKSKWKFRLIQVPALSYSQPKKLSLIKGRKIGVICRSGGQPSVGRPFQARVRFPGPPGTVCLHSGRSNGCGHARL